MNSSKAHTITTTRKTKTKKCEWNRSQNRKQILHTKSHCLINRFYRKATTLLFHSQFLSVGI